MATAATPITAAAASPDRAASQAWNPFFEQLRPVASVDARRVVVLFADPSLGEWVAAGDRELDSTQRREWVKRALTVQQKRLDALAAGGVQFRIEHQYIRVANGASILVHGDGAQLIRSMPGVALVAPVRTIWPTAISDEDAGAAGAAAAAGAQSQIVAAPDAGATVDVAVLDTGIDGGHPAIAGRLASSFDATIADDAKQAKRIAADEHGTAVAGAVLAGAGDGIDIKLRAVRVLAQQPARDGVEAVLGSSDDLLAGLEHAVDPNGDGDVADAADVALVASTAPYAGFTGSPEDRAAQAADALGMVVVAAAGNDGASGDEVGTVGSVAASTAALAIGAADLRGETPAASVRVRGGGIDETFADAPVLTAASTELPKGRLPIVVVESSGGEVVDYLDTELRSRVAGAVALIATREGVTVAEQVRAAADAGATAVLVGSSGAASAAGIIHARGADIPAIGIDRSDARALRDAIAGGERLAVSFEATSERNPAFGTVAGFSSAGPRLDGIGRPDALAPGVGMLVAASGDGWRVASGTSIAAGWAAGQVAAVRAQHPAWDAATVRAALLGSAIALGEVGDRPDVSRQGAGVLDAARATRATQVAASGRLDFGSVTAGSTARLDLGLVGTSSAADAAGRGSTRILLDTGGRNLPVSAVLDGEVLVLSVDAGAQTGHVGGWLVLPEQELRIPWSATVRDAASASVPVRAALTNAVLRPVAGPGAFASTLTLSIGGNTEAGDALGLAAVQRLEVRLIDVRGKDRGAIGGLDHALPGIYTFGLTGVDADGARLKAGAWKLRVRYVPAADPDGAWRAGPESVVRVLAPRRAR